MLVMSSPLLESLGPVYPLVGPTSKCGYFGQVVVVSDHQDRIRSFGSKRVGILCDHEYTKLEDFSQGGQTNHIGHKG